jgi:hypothetical protein
MDELQSVYEVKEFQYLLSKLMPTYDFVEFGTVVSVENTSCTVLRLGEEQTLSGVCWRLGGADGGQCVDVRPAVGAKVVLVYADNIKINAFIVHANKVDRVIAKTGEKALLIQEDGVVLNDGAFGGLVKVEALVSKLNALETEVSGLKARLALLETTYNTHTHVASSVGAPTATPLPVVSAGDGAALQQTVRGDVENEHVKHG